MTDFMAALFTGTLRRLLAVAIGGAVVALNNKWGLGLDAGQIAGIVALVVVYVAQSALRQGKSPALPDLVRLIQEGIEKAMKPGLPTPPERPSNK